jgi:hypothetical protein
MPPQFGSTVSERLPLSGRVHVVGAGPVGLAMAALLQSNERLSVDLYQKRRDYSRTRMVKLAPYLVADSIASYCSDYIDDASIEAMFEPSELLGIDDAERPWLGRDASLQRKLRKSRAQSEQS